jgi:hypothetical protein
VGDIWEGLPEEILRGTQELERELAKLMVTGEQAYGALIEGVRRWGLENAVTVQNLIETSRRMFDQLVSGVGDMVARTIVYQENLGQAAVDLLKSLAASIIQTIVQWVAAAIVNSLIYTDIKGLEAARVVSQKAAETYAAAFASTVGFLTPAGAAGYAAGAVGVMLAGASAAAATSMGQMVGVLGALHGGIQRVPATGPYVLQKDETVLTQPAAAEYRRESAGSRRAHELRQLVLKLDGRELSRALLDLVDTGELPMALQRGRT